MLTFLGYKGYSSCLRSVTVRILNKLYHISHSLSTKKWGYPSLPFLPASLFVSLFPSFLKCSYGLGERVSSHNAI